jgi:hypothetical protein
MGFEWGRLRAGSVAPFQLERLRKNAERAFDAQV